MESTTTYAPTGSDGGVSDAAAGGSLTPPGQSAEPFLPSLAWARVRVADANEALVMGRYEEMRAHLDMARAIMRFLELQAKADEARS